MFNMLYKFIYSVWTLLNLLFHGVGCGLVEECGLWGKARRSPRPVNEERAAASGATRLPQGPKLADLKLDKWKGNNEKYLHVHSVDPQLKIFI